MKKLEQLQKGISDACKAYDTYVLGGDTNEGENLVLTGTAIGIIKNEKLYPVSVANLAIYFTHQEN